MEDVKCLNCGRAVHPYRDTEDGKCPECRNEHAAVSEYRKTKQERCRAAWAKHCCWAETHNLIVTKEDDDPAAKIHELLVELWKPYTDPFGDILEHLEEFNKEELEYLMDNMPYGWHRSKVCERHEEVLDKSDDPAKKES